MAEQKQGIIFVQIPTEVAFNKNLNQTDGFVFWMIESLDSTKEHCWASNDYISKKLNVHSQTVSNSITKLKKYKYIEQISFNGRKRILKINNNYKKIYRYILEEYNSSISRSAYAAYNDRLMLPKPNLIVDNNIDNNIDKANINISISDSRIAQDKNSLVKNNQTENPLVKKCNIKEQIAVRLIRYWSSFEYTANHEKNPNSKTYQKMIKKLVALQKGTFDKIGPFDSDWIIKNNIPEKWFTQAWTFQELKTGLDLALRYSQDDYWPADKKYFKSLDSILYSIPYKKEKGASWLFNAMQNPPQTTKKTFQKIPLEQTVNKLIKNPIWPKNYEFNKYHLGKGLEQIKNFADNLIRDPYDRCHLYFGSLHLLLKEYLSWIDENDWIDINENIIGTENKVFRKFIEAQEKDIGIEIKSKGWKK